MIVEPFDSGADQVALIVVDVTASIVTVGAEGVSGELGTVASAKNTTAELPKLLVATKLNEYFTPGVKPVIVFVNVVPETVTEVNVFSEIV